VRGAIIGPILARFGWVFRNLAAVGFLTRTENPRIYRMSSNPVPTLGRCVRSAEWVLDVPGRFDLGRERPAERKASNEALKRHQVDYSGLQFSATA
jgi:hypothetical protein